MVSKSCRALEVLALAVLLVLWPRGLAQNPSGSKQETPYEIQLPVDEVSIFFRAADAGGLTVSDLKLQELDLFDNEEGPGQILSLQPLADRPVSAGFLIDVSGSVTNYMWESRALAAQLAQKLMARSGSSGLVVSFGRSRKVILPWNNQEKSVLAAIGQTGPGHDVAREGTGIFDALFDTCHYEFGGQSMADSQHVILLFSDGEYTASYMSLRDAVDACQHAHTVVYAFAPKLTPGTASTGPATLRDLTERTGGRVIRADGAETERTAAIERLINDLRQEYELFYKPINLKHDGAFHRIVLVGPKRVARIDAQSGYYAPTR